MKQASLQSGHSGCSKLPRGTIAVRVAGSGPRLLQIHGVGTGHRNFDLLTPLLTTDLEVFDIDLARLWR